MDEDAFLINAALGNDLLTAYAGASDDDDPEPEKKPGCLTVLLFLAILIAVIIWLA